MFISNEDYKLAAKPKFNAFYFGSVYAACCAFLTQQYNMNPEKFYKKFLFKFPVSIAFGLAPFIATAYFVRSQYKINEGIYERTCGNMSDLDLIELDIKFNPSKLIVY